MEWVWAGGWPPLPLFSRAYFPKMLQKWSKKWPKSDQKWPILTWKCTKFGILHGPETPILGHFWTTFGHPFWGWNPKWVRQTPDFTKTDKSGPKMLSNLSKSGQILPKTVFFVFLKTAKNAQSVKNPKKRVFCHGKMRQKPKKSKKITKIAKNGQKSTCVRECQRIGSDFSQKNQKNTKKKYRKFPKRKKRVFF